MENGAKSSHQKTTTENEASVLRLRNKADGRLFLDYILKSSNRKEMVSLSATAETGMKHPKARSTAASS